MDTSSPDAASMEDALRYVLANVDDAPATLETAGSALASATAYGWIAVPVTTTTAADRQRYRGPDGRPWVRTFDSMPGMRNAKSWLRFGDQRVKGPGSVDQRR